MEICELKFFSIYLNIDIQQPGPSFHRHWTFIILIWNEPNDCWKNEAYEKRNNEVSMHDKSVSMAVKVATKLFNIVWQFKNQPAQNEIIWNKINKNHKNLCR